jgi:hypothetical protein
MKKRILIGVAGLAFVAAAAITTITTLNANTTESDLLSKNLVALTQNEDQQSYTCENSGVYKKGSNTFMCDICDWNPNTAEGPGSTGSCTK